MNGARRDPRLAWSAFALCLPTVAVVAMGLWFLVCRVPEMARREDVRVAGEYLAIGEALRDGRLAPSFVWGKAREQKDGAFVGAKPDGVVFPENLSWKAWTGRPDGRSDESSGRLPLADGRVAVWCRDGWMLRGVVVPPVEPVDYVRMFWSGGAVFLFVLVAMTAAGVRYFVEYAVTRDDFLSATAHDLTTPLVGLRYVIGRDDEEARNLNERMIRLVGNIRDFMRLGRRRAPCREKVDVRAAFGDAYRVFAADYAAETSGPVSVEGPDAVFACADETLCVQILWNLLGNDLKYAAPFGRVAVSFRQTKTDVAVVVSDEGPGLSPAQRRRAFDRYYRARTVLESGKGGFGIGLCTSREFARAMGGDLTVAANAPKGCVFTLVLPRWREGEARA